MDAFIAAWEAKRFYDSVRPYTLVRLYHTDDELEGWAGPGKGVTKMKSSAWVPYSPETFITPSFPGYVSGNSTVSAACAKVFELFTGSDRFGFVERRAPGTLTSRRRNRRRPKSHSTCRPSARRREWWHLAHHGWLSHSSRQHRRTEAGTQSRGVGVATDPRLLRGDGVASLEKSTRSAECRYSILLCGASRTSSPFSSPPPSSPVPKSRCRAQVGSTGTRNAEHGTRNESA